MLTFIFLAMVHHKLTGLYVITSPSRYRDEVKFAAEAVEAGARIIQLREKDEERALRIGETLRAITKEQGALLIVNDFPEVAKALGADGVHLGQEDMPLREARGIMGKDKLIGKSTHSLEQALEAEKEGTDYVGIGPIYATKTKDYEPIGPGVLYELRQKLSIPFVAIGGINEKNINEVMEAGAGCVAMVSPLAEAEDVRERVKFFIRKTGGE